MKLKLSNIIVIILIMLTAANIYMLNYTVTIHGKSMEPILQEGKKYYTSKIKYNDLKVGDIILFKLDDVRMVKLVKGVHLDEYQKVITGDRDFHYINNIPLLKNYPKYEDIPNDCIIDTYILKDKEVFVLGVNHNSSIDSRYYGVVGLGDSVRIIRRKENEQE